MLKLVNRQITQRRNIRTTALQWPLDDSVKLSSKLLDIESRWKSRLDEEFRVKWTKRESNDRKYILSMFPYPSGNLHMGHMRVYTISDVTARYYMLNGYNVIHPIGWDSFGLPAENAARDHGVDPRVWTKSNINVMKKQLLRTGVQFDWNREISTCEPEFYKWTQWIFLKLYEKGLVKRTLSEVNWDPIDGTVLAAEQIDNEGRSWRSGAVAEKKKLCQWMIETPKYAMRLSDGLRAVEQWHEVTDIQSNWIGICDAYRFQFPLRESENNLLEEVLDLRVQDPTSIGKAWFIILRQGHTLSNPDRKDDKEPYLLPIQVLNGVTAEWMPIVVVPTEYSGPEMFLNVRVGDLDIDREVINKFGLKKNKRVMPMNTNDVLEIASFGGYGGYQTSRTLQDWVVSRQRSWGTPVPMILSEDGKNHTPLSVDQLPLLQGQGRTKVNSDRLPNGYGYYDGDTLDTFFDSSWYYLRFLDNENTDLPISKEKSTLMPVDVYVGGIEHAAVHMFFARFISYFLNDIGSTTVAEPFRHLIPQGIVRGKTFIEPSSGQYHKNEEVLFENGQPKSSTGIELQSVYEKMSKSKHNGVDPLQVINRDGVDLTRLQILDAAAPRQPINWGENDAKGIRKWLDRVAWIVSNFIVQKAQNHEGINVDQNIESVFNESYNFFVRNVGMCLEVLNLHNTGLMRIIGFTNALRKHDPAVLASSPAAERCIIALLSMIQVYAPHAANEMFTAVQESLPDYKDKSLIDIPWPQIDEDASIDFMLYIDNVSCGRYSIPRKEIEELNENEIIAKSLTQYHRQFVEKLKKNGGNLTNIRVTRRKGFHVSLYASIGGADTSLVGKTLDQLQSEYTSAKKAKRKMKA